jgi:2-polyprenyl-3-methyl-5-hydroxy-6-metoxy-1,4-benzoquinol methylase
MKTTKEVCDLFNAKASSWNQKYQPEGPLAYRIGAFTERVRASVPPQGKVLDLGCGTGALAVHLARQGYAMTACDIAEGMLKAGAEAYPTVSIEWVLLSASWKTLPFGPGSFDAIVSSSVFEYIDDVENILRECSKVLNPGGWLIFTAPNPANAIRRLEKIIRPLAVASLALPGLRAVPKLGNYFQYLKLSRCRYATPKWHELGSLWGLRPSASSGSGAGNQSQHPPLIFLSFRKTLSTTGI